MGISSDRRLTPEELEAKKEREKQTQARLAGLRKDISETFASASGRNTLRWLMELCGYQMPMTTADPETREVQVNNIIHNAALHGLYLRIRSQVSRETLIVVEHRGLEKDEKGKQ